MNKSELRMCQCARCEARVHCMRSRESAEEARSAAVVLTVSVVAGLVGVMGMALGAWLW